MSALAVFLPGNNIRPESKRKSRSDTTTNNITALSRDPGNLGWTNGQNVIFNFYGRYISKSVSNSPNTWRG